MRRTSRRACAIAAATLMIAGCNTSGGGSSGPAPAGIAGTVGLVHPSAYVGGAPAGAGTAIYAAQHVHTNGTGQASYTIGTGALLSCYQDTGVDVTAEPSSAVLLRYNSGNGTVTCGTSPSKGSQCLTLTAPHMKIKVMDPVFTIARQDGKTIVRVYEGRVMVTSSNGGPAVTVSAGQQLAVADGQPPGPPTAFSTAQISKFELHAVQQLVTTRTPAPSTSSGGAVIAPLARSSPRRAPMRN